MEINEIQFAQSLAKAMQDMQRGQRNDPGSLTAVGPYNHGAGGLFSTSGVDARVFSAFMLPTDGVLSVIPVANGEDDSPEGDMFGGVQQAFFTTLTGVTQGDAEDFANQPTEDCADGARTGLLKACTLISTYGRYRFSPRAPISLYRVGWARDVADPTYLQLMNQPSPQSMGLMNPFALSLPGGSGGMGNVMMSEFARRFFEMRVSIARFFARRVWVASPANNSGERREFSGLDLHVNTGNKVDAISSNICTAMNSIITNFFNGNVSTSTAAAANLVRILDSVMFRLMFVARREGLMPVEWVMVMRPEVFDEIVKIWPVAYYMEALTQISAFTNGRVVLSGKETTDFRDDMRENFYLPIRGRRISVLLDEGLAEENVTNNAGLVAGQYISDIVILPLTVAGGVRSLYWKTFNYANNQAEAFVRAMNLGSAFTFTSDGGAWRWYVNFKNGCLDLTAEISPSLRLRTPQLAAKIENVAYQPYAHLQSAFPDSAYFADGGRTNDPTIQKFYTEWSPTTPVTFPV